MLKVTKEELAHIENVIKVIEGARMSAHDELELVINDTTPYAAELLEAAYYNDRLTVYLRPTNIIFVADIIFREDNMKETDEMFPKLFAVIRDYHIYVEKSVEGVA